MTAATPHRPAILVIDDNLDQLGMLATALADRFEVLTASDGLEGYTVACRESPAAIILDVVMPVVDGWTVLRKLQSNPGTQRIPVIVFTAVDPGAIGGEARSLGAVAVLRKPASAAELASVLDAVIVP